MEEGLCTVRVQKRRTRGTSAVSKSFLSITLIAITDTENSFFFLISCKEFHEKKKWRFVWFSHLSFFNTHTHTNASRELH